VVEQIVRANAAAERLPEFIELRALRIAAADHAVGGGGARLPHMAT